MFNFSEASQHLLEAQAAWRVNDAAELADTAAKLFTDPALRQTAGQRGKAVVEANRGALAKLLRIIEGVLEGRQPTLDKSS
jgi:3-deoxy-D-manno-octulosonic-acid transferase